MNMGQRENAIIIEATTLLGIRWWDEIKQQPKIN